MSQEKLDRREFVKSMSFYAFTIGAMIKNFLGRGNPSKLETKGNAGSCGGQSELIAQIDSAKVSRSVLFDYSKEMDLAYRRIAVLTSPHRNSGKLGDDRYDMKVTNFIENMDYADKRTSIAV